MPVILHFRTVGHGEAKTREDVDNFVLHDGERVARAQSDGVRRAGKVNVGMVGFLASQRLAKRVDLVLQGCLQFVDFHAHLTLLLGGNFTELSHEVVNETFLAQIFDAKRLKGLLIGSLQFSHFLEQ